MGGSRSLYARGLTFGTEIQDQVVVAAISENGPADEAEIKVGDIVVAVDDVRVKFWRSFSGMSGPSVMPE